ncbi:hypothetical protein [Ruthenibacterium lactatiformans]|nr:hypothetical protein [Ruthenibacterium lactatiformans]
MTALILRLDLSGMTKKKAGYPRKAGISLTAGKAACLPIFVFIK